MIDGFQPSAIHISTEGPLGLAARRHCLRRGYAFTTAFHTRFPEYVHARCRAPVSWGYAFERWFHGPSSGMMVSTQSVEDALRARGFKNIRRWSRGVDTELFHPREKGFFRDPRPISLYVGRVAVEKNIGAFLELELNGTKYVVGDGPQLSELRARHPEVRFTGAKMGEELACHYAAADVLVFPSKTDTFGLVILEALASGVPVAAYPVAGPIDVIADSGAGCLDWDLGKAATEALSVPAERCRAHALTYSWQASARQFLGNLHILDKDDETAEAAE